MILQSGQYLLKINIETKLFLMIFTMGYPSKD